MNVELTHKVKTIDLGFGVYDLYPRWVQGEWISVEATPDQVLKLKHVFDEEYGGAPYGYIGNRVNPHSVDAAGVSNILRLAENLKAIAFVVYDSRARMVADLEKQFYRSHAMKVFPCLDSAQDWMVLAMEKYYIS